MTWYDALSHCNRVGGTLAKISREGLRFAFSKLLEKQRPVLYNLHIGLTSRDNWVWIDGSPLNASFWMPGYPSCFHCDTELCCSIGRFIEFYKH